MIQIKIDGNQICSRDELHQLFREALQLEDYYGNNLDALYDVLSTYCEPVEIHITNEEALCSAVPYYGERTLGMLNVAAEENETNIILKWDDRVETPAEDDEDYY